MPAAPAADRESPQALDDLANDLAQMGIYGQCTATVQKPREGGPPRRCFGTATGDDTLCAVHRRKQITDQLRNKATKPPPKRDDARAHATGAKRVDFELDAAGTMNQSNGSLFRSVAERKGMQVYYLDSGASEHVAGKNARRGRHFKGSTTVSTSGGVRQTGRVQLKGMPWPEMDGLDLPHSPNLLSIGKLIQEGHVKEQYWDKSGFYVRCNGESTWTKVDLDNNVPKVVIGLNGEIHGAKRRFDFEKKCLVTLIEKNVEGSVEAARELLAEYEKVGDATCCPSFVRPKLQKAAHDQVMHFPADKNCEVCIKAKLRHEPVSHSDEPHERKDRTHLDTQGPISIPDVYGNVYTQPLRHDLSAARESTVKSGNTVDDSIEAYKKAQFGVLSDHRTPVTRTDNGPEFSGEFTGQLLALNIRHETSLPNEDHTHGFIESTHRDSNGGTRSSLIQSGAPPGLWGKALGYWNYCYNRKPRRLKGESEPTTPIERLGMTLTDRDKNLPPFGCKVLYKVRGEHHDFKFAPLTEERAAVFVGFSPCGGAEIMLLDELLAGHTRHLFRIVRTCRFEETFPMKDLCGSDTTLIR
ncbi:MAG: hypothetical protein ABGY41_14530, partial [Candidatus Poribacteria bacterium]